MILVVSCLMVVAVVSAVAWLICDARRQTRRCDAFYQQMRGAANPEPVKLVWDSADDRQLRQLLETGDR